MNRPLILLLLLGMITACSNRAMYENLRIQQRNECFIEPLPLQQACLERAGTSYEEYQRQRGELSRQ